MAPGVAGVELTVIAAVRGLLLPQVPSDVTDTLPEVAPKLTVIAVVP